MTNGGIFGPKLSGKTTLAKSISRQYWSQHHLRSLILDINGDTWGGQAWTTSNETEFWGAVWKTQGCLIIVDEATETINRDKELLPVFTRLRHNHHKLLVIGHSGMNLLPMMREQLDTLYLFRQPEQAAKVWSNIMADKAILACAELNQFEFLHCEIYKAPKRYKLKL